VKLTVNELFHQADTVLYNLYFSLLNLNVQNSFTRLTRCIIIFLYQPGETKCSKIVLQGCYHQIFNFLISPVKLTVNELLYQAARYYTLCIQPCETECTKSDQSGGTIAY